ncbi:hypothetical protein J4731_23660 [Providencia rettgeri]|nr:hypothetical protein [Providencia rettgeri]
MRVDDMDIAALPNARTRRNKQVGFNGAGEPILLDPAETGALGYIISGTFEKGANKQVPSIILGNGKQII